MDRHDATGSTGWCRRFLLALSLCVFAFAYGAPAGVAAHARMAGMATDAGCPEGAGHPTRSGKSGTAMAGCCVAHCLPAVPMAPDADRIAGLSNKCEPPVPNEGGEGRTVAVQLPPPRSAVRA